MNLEINRMFISYQSLYIDSKAISEEISMEFVYESIKLENLFFIDENM